MIPKSSLIDSLLYRAIMDLELEHLLQQKPLRERGFCQMRTSVSAQMSA
jgi:hypothetical protein